MRVFFSSFWTVIFCPEAIVELPLRRSRKCRFGERVSHLAEWGKELVCVDLSQCGFVQNTQTLDPSQFQKYNPMIATALWLAHQLAILWHTCC